MITLTNCTNLLNELSKVATKKTQKKLLEDLAIYSKQNNLTNNQKELANKLYKELRARLISSLETQISRELTQLSDYYLDSFVTSMKGCTSHYPLKDIMEAFTNVLNKPYMKEQKNFNQILAAYGRVFLL